jgi:hypothetical protein
MASPIQQQILRRKLAYTGLIIVLFSAAYVWRHSVMDSQAVDLAIREKARGEVELSGALIRLMLTGSRGLATTALWWQAMETQKRNEWNELEVLVRSVAKLQPHFITPWLFQSWNLSYNVSVEADRVSDKFFYVSRGISLLAQGERQNKNDPDMRWSLGFYTQHKICQSDETNVMRSLFQLSGIPPNERDPERFKIREGKRERINMEEFEDFCLKHPQLVRRLKEGMRREYELDRQRQFYCKEPKEVVQFLADNLHVPSVYEDIKAAAPGKWQRQPQPSMRKLEEKFPVLPPAHQPAFNQETLNAESPPLEAADAYAVARAWFNYALEPIPPPDVLPGSVQPIQNRGKERKPRYMTTVIFLAYPAQGQRYIGERLQQEGWFDDAGWVIPDWFEEQGNRFQTKKDERANPAPARIGETLACSSLEAWQAARKLWEEHGRRNKLLFDSPAQEQNMRDLAEEFQKKFRTPVGAHPPPNLRRDLLDPEVQKEYDASLYMFEYEYSRRVGNFAHHYARSQVEALPETVRARKLFYEAEAARYSGAGGERVLAIFRNPGALAGWYQILMNYKDFRLDSLMQEETYTTQHRYLRVLHENYRNPLNWKAGQLAVAMTTPWCGAAPIGLPGCLAPVMPPRWWDERLTWFDAVQQALTPLSQPWIGAAQRFGRLQNQAISWNAAQLVLAGTAAPGAGAIPLDLLACLPPVLPSQLADVRVSGSEGQVQLLPGGSGVRILLPPWWDKTTNDWLAPLLGGPFDGNDNTGQPLISAFVRKQMLDRYYPALQKKKPAAGPGGPVPTSPQPQEAGGVMPQQQAR